MKNWHVNFDITTYKGRVIKKSARVTDPARHYGEYLKRFYPSARIIDWVPTTADHKTELGPHRIVEFNEDGSVKHRIPDHDHAHVGGLEDNHTLEGVDYNVSGTGRAGLHPHDQLDLGAHPTLVEHDDDNDEDGPDLVESPARIDGEQPTPVTQSTPSASERSLRPPTTPTLGQPGKMASPTTSAAPPTRLTEAVDKPKP